MKLKFFVQSVVLCGYVYSSTTQCELGYKDRLIYFVNDYDKVEGGKEISYYIENGRRFDVYRTPDYSPKDDIPTAEECYFASQERMHNEMNINNRKLRFELSKRSGEDNEEM